MPVESTHNFILWAVPRFRRPMGIVFQTVNARPAPVAPSVGDAGGEFGHIYASASHANNDAPNPETVDYAAVRYRACH